MKILTSFLKLYMKSIFYMEIKFIRENDASKREIQFIFK